jgi:hypothetical protein
MKEIDILNGIATGEIKPGFKIKKENGDIYEYIEGANYFRNVEDKMYVWTLGYFSNLNNEIEIVEEDKKIEKLNEEIYHDEPALIDDMAHKINEIIDKIEELESKERSIK